MSFRDELKTALDDAGIQWNNLIIDKDADHHGRPALKVGFIINGSAGPATYESWITDDLKLGAEEAAALVAINAKKHYANFAQDVKESNDQDR